MQSAKSPLQAVNGEMSLGCFAIFALLDALVLFKAIMCLVCWFHARYRGLVVQSSPLSSNVSILLMYGPSSWYPSRS